MEEKETKKFELNTKVLENFDKIMSTKLDEIEELKITGLDKGSKLLNIISLCANLKTLIIEGDPRINSDKILTNLFQPENLENLIFNNVKIPKPDSLKRFTNLKMISLNDIRICPIEDFFGGIVNPERMEIINICSTDLSKHSIKVLSRFTKLKYLKLEELKNVKLDCLKFLKDNKSLLKIEIINTSIVMSELDHLMKCKCTKNIDVCVVDEKGNKIENCQFKIQENLSEITVLINDLDRISKEVNLYRIKKVNVILNERADSSYYIKYLKKLKCEAHIRINDFTSLDVVQAKKIKDVLKLENIEFLNLDKITEFNVDDYIIIRQEIENIIQNISAHVSELEQFLEIYQYLGKEFIISENQDIGKRTCTAFQICQLLQNCLKCIGIYSEIILGEELENNQKHYWNQVELDKKWYNVDLALDMDKIKKNKVEYCLLGDSDFLETHVPKSGKNHYCAENYNPKLINVYFKTGLLREGLLKSYLEVMIEKFKKIFQSNKKQEILALPETIEEEKNQ